MRSRLSSEALKSIGGAFLAYSPSVRLIRAARSRASVLRPFPHAPSAALIRSTLSRAFVCGFSSSRPCRVVRVERDKLRPVFGGEAVSAFCRAEPGIASTN
jgi:hypothetical protein